MIYAIMRTEGFRPSVLLTQGKERLVKTYATKICPNCKAPFQPSRGSTLYCSSKCCAAWHRKKYREEHPLPVIDPRLCPVCETSFTPKSITNKYCSDQCRREDRAPNRPGEYVDRSASGAASELTVCADLLRLGYYAFRSVSPSCPCDLVAMKGESLIRIEVKTVPVKVDGELVQIGDKSLARHNHDVLAYVDHSGGVHYTPALS